MGLKIMYSFSGGYTTLHAPWIITIIKLSNLRRHDLHSVAIAWWQFNRRTPLFRHPQTARIVRSILKDGEAPAPM